ncbi:class I SAM-dependent methyltransferase [Portibacter marinus]|uniref:class I SAM-dependent methyltransferase n=1 Tax=Portibacter marinus TaxID=2898660 RepID=UPI001F326EC4|nr:class I SAM-dependent methyltransferase [Portibacter marinus]
MYEFHKDKKRYFEMQKNTSAEYIIPFVSQHIDLTTPKHILEIGCAEAGVLKAFTKRGHYCTGIELHQARVETAKTFFQEELKDGHIKFFVNDIMQIDVMNDIGHQFDLIILKDVIEHIPNQAAFIERLPAYLKPQGMVFFGFPPWYMPFGGHQQICSNKILSLLPYYHLLPKPIYKSILKAAGEKEGTVKELMEIKDTGISIERFKRIVRSNKFNIMDQKQFLINPIYKYKFNLKPRNQLPIIKDIPFFRNFVSTCVYFLIKRSNSTS